MSFLLLDCVARLEQGTFPAHISFHEPATPPPDTGVGACANPFPPRLFCITDRLNRVAAAQNFPHLVMASPDHNMYRLEKPDAYWNIWRTGPRHRTRASMNVIWTIRPLRRTTSLPRKPLLSFVTLFLKNLNLR